MRKCVENSGQYGDCDVPVLLYLARAYYKNEQFKECKTTLMKALHIKPDNELLWYNLALAQQEHACELTRPKADRTLEEVDLARREAEAAFRQFARLASSSEHSGVSRAKATEHRDFCVQLVDHVAQRRLEALRYHADQDARRHTIERQRVCLRS
jgi:hypothetical protein